MAPCFVLVYVFLACGKGLESERRNARPSVGQKINLSLSPPRQGPRYPLLGDEVLRLLVGGGRATEKSEPFWN